VAFSRIRGAPWHSNRNQDRARSNRPISSSNKPASKVGNKVARTSAAANVSSKVARVVNSKVANKADKDAPDVPAMTLWR